jgi:hypothetical protein
LRLKRVEGGVLVFGPPAYTALRKPSGEARRFHYASMGI